MTIYNFSAGPAVLPKEVLLQAQAELLDWHGSGMSVMEMSHRGKEYMGIHAQAEADLRELMGDSRQLQGAVPARRRAPAVLHDPVEPVARQALRRLREYRRMVEEGHRRSEEVQLRECGGGQQRQEMHLCACIRYLEAGQGCGLRALHAERNHRRRRVQLDSQHGRCAAGGGHVVQHPVASRGCMEVRPDLRRCAEEHRPGRSDDRDRARRSDRPRHPGACRPCSITRRMPTTTPCTTRRPPMPSTWPGWCSSG